MPNRAAQANYHRPSPGTAGLVALHRVTATSTSTCGPSEGSEKAPQLIAGTRSLNRIMHAVGGEPQCSSARGGSVFPSAHWRSRAMYCGSAQRRCTAPLSRSSLPADPSVSASQQSLPELRSAEPTIAKRDDAKCRLCGTDEIQGREQRRRARGGLTYTAS